MKAKLIDVADLKKTDAEKQAEALLQQLFQEGNKKAIEVVLNDKETPRKVNNIFRRAAETLGKEIRIRSKEGRTIILVK